MQMLRFAQHDSPFFHSFEEQERNYWGDESAHGALVKGRGITGTGVSMANYTPQFTLILAEKQLGFGGRPAPFSILICWEFRLFSGAMR
jgi:hypothetical protein